MITTTIYIYLADEGDPECRPCRAERLSEDRYRILDEAPKDEMWEFTKGDVVHCKRKILIADDPQKAKQELVAYEIAA